MWCRKTCLHKGRKQAFEANLRPLEEPHWQFQIYIHQLLLFLRVDTYSMSQIRASIYFSATWHFLIGILFPSSEYSFDWVDHLATGQNARANFYSITQGSSWRTVENALELHSRNSTHGIYSRNLGTHGIYSRILSLRAPLTTRNV